MTSPDLNLPPHHRPASLLSSRRIGAMILRYSYVLRSSWPRILELAYWPTIQMVLWGFMTLYLLQNSSILAQATGVLITGVLLWDVLFRSNLGVAIPYMEEMYSRNLGQLFVTPMRPFEFCVSLMAISGIRTILAVLPASLLALPFFDVWVFETGLPLMAFFINLLMSGWALGLVIVGLLLRYGLGAESFAWLGVFLLAPISCVWFPLDILPGWLQIVALSLPMVYVFEGMRGVLFDGIFHWDLLFWAVGLNIFYIGLGALYLMAMFHKAREMGLLLQQGE